MNRLFRFSFTAYLLVFLLASATSCTVQKRHYRPGFFVQHPGSPKNVPTGAEKVSTANKDDVKTNPAGQPQTASANGETVLADAVPETERPSGNTIAEKNNSPEEIRNAPAAPDTTQKLVKPRSEKIPVHPRIRAATILTGVVYFYYALVGVLILITSGSLSLEAAVLLTLGIIVISSLLVVSAVLAISGLRQIKDQKENTWRGKKLGRVILSLDIIPFLLFLIFWPMRR